MRVLAVLVLLLSGATAVLAAFGIPDSCLTLPGLAPPSGDSYFSLWCFILVKIAHPTAA
jgi:hypothetical protein